MEYLIGGGIGAMLGSGLSGGSNNTPATVQQLQNLTPLQQSLMSQMALLLGGTQFLGMDTGTVSDKQIAKWEASIKKKKEKLAADAGWYDRHPDYRRMHEQSIADYQSKILAANMANAAAKMDASAFPSEGLLMAPGQAPDFPLTAAAQPLTKQAYSAGANLIPSSLTDYQQGVSGLDMPTEALNTALGSYGQGMTNLNMPTGFTNTALAGYGQGMSGLSQPQWNFNDYMSQVGRPLADWQMNQFTEEVIPTIANQFGALDSARSSGMTKALGRAAQNMGLGMNAQMSPQAFSAAQAGQDRSLAANTAMMQGGLSGLGLGQTGAQSQAQLGLSGLGLGQTGAQARGQLGLAGLGTGAAIAGSQQDLAQQQALSDFQKWQMSQPGMDPRVQMLMGNAFIPSYGYIGMPGTQTPSTLSQVAGPLAYMFGNAGGFGMFS